MIFQDLAFAQIASFGIAFAFIFASAASIIYIIKGGISAIFASGDAEKVKEAIHTVRYAIVGLVIVFMAVVIVKILGAIFGLDLLQYLSVEEVGKMFNLIMKRLQGDYSDLGNGDPLDF